MRARYPLLCLVCAFNVLGLNAASASTVSLSATGVGSFVGGSAKGSRNYSAATLADLSTFRNVFVFDLSGLTGTVLTATLNLNDNSRPIARTIDRVSDFESGILLGGSRLSVSSAGGIRLNDAFIDAANAPVRGLLGIGGSLAAPEDLQGLTFVTSSGAGTLPTLTLEMDAAVAPLPAAAWAGIALLAKLGLTRRRPVSL